VILFDAEAVARRAEEIAASVNARHKPQFAPVPDKPGIFPDDVHKPSTLAEDAAGYGGPLPSR
jgi:hypothetical protein